MFCTHALLQDQTQTNLINLRRTIYLTIMSSAQFEEAGHKLMKIQLAPGQEIEVVTMLIECCSQEKTYIKWVLLSAAGSMHFDVVLGPQCICLGPDTLDVFCSSCFLVLAGKPQKHTAALLCMHVLYVT